jgi:acetyltransferase-like isoleucine patch superfamily enzyme
MTQTLRDLALALRNRAVNSVARFAYKGLALNAGLVSPLRVEGKKYISIDKGVTVQRYTWLFAAPLDGCEPSLTIGEGSSIGESNHIAAVRRVTIGRRVLTAKGVYISDNLHGYDDVRLPIMDQPVRFKNPVTIGDGAWIGENACVIGASVGKNAVIGANAVVTRDVPDFSVAVGVPARVIKRYHPGAQRWERVGP